MKYGANNKPLECIMSDSSCYKGTKEMKIKGVLLHSTGANNPKLSRYVQPPTYNPNRAKLLELLGTNHQGTDWNSSKQSAGVNAWIGRLADGTVSSVQALPWNYRPWGCGKGWKGSCNDGWIQIEICEGNLDDESYFNLVYREAVELIAYICNIHGLDPNGYVEVSGTGVPVILCHADAHKLGLGSNHADIYHWFNRYGKSMDTVRADVTNLLKVDSDYPKVEVEKPKAEYDDGLYRVRKTWLDVKSQVGAYKSLDNAIKACPLGYTVYDSKGHWIHSSKKTLNDIAKEVIKGLWGNGEARKVRLKASGYDPAEVQKVVNKMLQGE